MQGFLNLLPGNSLVLPTTYVTRHSEHLHFLCPTLFVTVQDPGFPSFIFFFQMENPTLFKVNLCRCSSVPLILLFSI